MSVSPNMKDKTHISIMRYKNEKGMMSRIALKTSSAVSSELSLSELSAFSRMPVSLTSLHCSASEISWTVVSGTLDFPVLPFAMLGIILASAHYVNLNFAGTRAHHNE
jgi:hypothetical protein